MESAVEKRIMAQLAPSRASACGGEGCGQTIGGGDATRTRKPDTSSLAAVARLRPPATSRPRDRLRRPSLSHGGGIERGLTRLERRIYASQVRVGVRLSPTHLPGQGASSLMRCRVTSARAAHMFGRPDHTADCGPWRPSARPDTMTSGGSMPIDRRRLLELTGFAAAERTTGLVAAALRVLGRGGRLRGTPTEYELKQERRRERLEALAARLRRKALAQGLLA